MMKNFDNIRELFYILIVGIDIKIRFRVLKCIGFQNMRGIIVFCFYYFQLDRKGNDKEGKLDSIFFVDRYCSKKSGY